MKFHQYRWLGSELPHLDQPAIVRCGNVVIGCFGGATAAGAHKNEDAALVWCAASGLWEFAVLLDAHHTTESAALLLKVIEMERPAILRLLQQPVSVALPRLSEYLISRLQSPALRARTQFITGESACLICARKGRFLWWLSVGDCSGYLFHPELARLGQFGLNQRSYYEWVGRTNTFDLPVACFSTGVKELREGANHILMTTDGLLDADRGYYQNPRQLFKDFTFWGPDLEAGVRLALGRVQRARGVDSATLITWRVVSLEPGMQASSPRP